MRTTRTRRQAADRTAEVGAAYAEYQAAYAAYEATTRMNVPTPEGCGTFGGVWDCDPDRLLRALVRAIRRERGVCSAAVEKTVGGITITVVDVGYGDLVTVPVADLYRTPNGGYCDPSSRGLTEAEVDILTSIVGDGIGRAPWVYGGRPHRTGSVITLAPTPAVPGDDRGYYYTPGRITKRFIDELAGSQIARTLTKPYLIGWPVSTDQQMIDACRRVAAIYRGLAADFAAS